MPFPEPPATANPMGMGSLDSNHYNNGPPDFVIKKNRNNAYATNNQGFNKKRGYTSSSYGTRPGRGNVSGSVKKEVLYRGEHDLGDGNYHVEVNQTVTNDLII